MTDQEKPIEQNPVNPVSAYPVQPPTVLEPPPDILPQSTVVVPASGFGVPRWFYFVFGATVIIFLVVTGMLVLQSSQKSKENGMGIPPTIIPISSIPPITSPSAVVPTTASSTQTETPGTTDEISSIEADINSLDLLLLDQNLEAIDSPNSTN